MILALSRLAVAVCVLVFGADQGAAQSPETRPPDAEIRAATAECRPARTAAPRNVVGISDPHASDPRVIDLVAESGAPWIRAEFHWSRIQPGGTGPYNWSEYDRMVELYNSKGIRVAAILTYIPQGMSDWDAIDEGFRKFASAAVARYAPRGVHVWEVFNEPNLTGYGWLESGAPIEPNLGPYALLLARANAAVRANDPQGVVVIGGLAGEGHRPLPPETTMDRLYSLGAAPCFDVMAYHPYGYQARFPEARARIDAILARHGDTGKPVWFNEYGWTDHQAMDLAVNRSENTNPMIKAFAQRGSADALFWFSARDHSARWNAPKFGLATHDFDKKGSFATFEVIMDAIR